MAERALVTMEAEPALVIGGGLLGATIARLWVAQGGTVTVCSRHPRPHAGLWRRIGDKLPIHAGMRVWVAIGPSPSERGERIWGEELPRLLEKLAGAQVLVCGPAGAGEAGIDAFAKVVQGIPNLRLPMLFGNDDPYLGDAARRLRDGGVVRLERNLPALWPLHVEDAARAAIAGVEGSLRGPDRWEPVKMVEALIDRYGQGSWRSQFRFWPSPVARRAAAQVELEDHWPESLGIRFGLASWIERLPGPRRRR